MYKSLQAKRRQELLSHTGIVPEDTHFCPNLNKNQDRSRGIKPSVRRLL
jgi:hypothetical protein